MAIKKWVTRTYKYDKLLLRVELYHFSTVDSTVFLEFTNPTVDVLKKGIGKLTLPFEVRTSGNKMRFASMKIRFVDIQNRFEILGIDQTTGNLHTVYLSLFITQPNIAEQQIWTGVLIPAKTRKKWTNPRGNVNEYETINLFFQERLFDLKDAVYGDLHPKDSYRNGLKIAKAWNDMADFLNSQPGTDLTPITASMSDVYAIRETNNYVLSASANTEGVTALLDARHIVDSKPVFTYLKKWLVQIPSFITTFNDKIYWFDRVNRPTASFDLTSLMKYEKIETDTIEYVEMKHQFGHVNGTNTTGALADYAPTIVYSTGSPSTVNKKNILIDTTTKGISFGLDNGVEQHSDFETEGQITVVSNLVGGKFNYPGGDGVTPISFSANIIYFETASFDASASLSTDHFTEEGQDLQKETVFTPFTRHRHVLGHFTSPGSASAEGVLYAPSQSLAFSASSATGSRTGSADEFNSASLSESIFTAALLRGAGTSVEGGWNHKVATVIQNAVSRYWEYYTQGEHLKIKLDSIFWNPTASISLNDKIYVPTKITLDFLNYTSEIEMREVSSSSHGTPDWLGGRPSQSFDSSSWLPTSSIQKFEGNFLQDEFSADAPQTGAFLGIFHPNSFVDKFEKTKLLL